jgi:hypothetical protein
MMAFPSKKQPRRFEFPLELSRHNLLAVEQHSQNDCAKQQEAIVTP